MDDRTIRAALRGDKEAARKCTKAGVALPCPFCGYEHVLCKKDSGGHFHINCVKCDSYLELGAGEKQHIKDRVLASWNTRAKLPDGKSNESCRQVTSKLNPSNSTSLQGWIDCSDHLPTPGERVLATTRRFVGEAYTDGKGRFYRHHGTSWETLGEVTHWMAFPEGPEVSP